MPNTGHLPILAAVLAVHAQASADVPERNLQNEIQVKLELVDGTGRECRVVRWGGLGLEGSCGFTPWDRIKTSAALAVLDQLAGKDDAAARRDAAVIGLSLEPKGSTAVRAVEWARKAGAEEADLARIREEAAALATERAARVRALEDARLARITPEAARFPDTPLRALHSHDIEAVSDATIEASRALLARAGGGGTLHRSERVALLAESGDHALVRDAVYLERFFSDWSRRIRESGVPLVDQGVVPVVLANDTDRWRLLVQAAFEGDAARFPDSVTIYPKSGLPEELRPIVLVNPSGDALRVRYGAAVGLARALLHCTGTPARPPAWLNEGLPRAMAAGAVPQSGMDAELRRRGLAALRSGGGFAAILDSRYGDGLWERDPELAQSLSYLLSCWMLEKEPARTMQYAHAPRIAETEAARFERIMGVSLARAAGLARSWYQTND